MSKNFILRFYASSLALILANVVPLLGVLFFGWGVFPIVMTYWFENLIIGLFNVLKILLYEANDNETPEAPEFENNPKLGIYKCERFSAGRIFLSIFFTIHYGSFCLVHGVFLIMLFGTANQEGKDGAPVLENGLSIAGLLLCVGALFLSHLFSFYRNFLHGGENHPTKPQTLLFAPYARITVLHLTIIFGAFAIQELDNRLLPLILLIIGKTLVDLYAHLRQHMRFAHE